MTPKQTAADPNKFVYRNDEPLQARLRFSPPKDGHVYVAMHTNCYGKSLPFLQAVADHLLTVIPFRYTTKGDPEVMTLAGPCYANIMSVQILVQFSIADVEAYRLLLANGFFEGLESVK